MKFFLSSTFSDLVNIRSVALKYLREITGAISQRTGDIIAMEYFDAAEASSTEKCMSELAKSDLVIAILGERYGSIAENGCSYTENEINFAIENGIPVLAFVSLDSEGREERETEFIKETILVPNRVASFYKDTEDFEQKLANSLREYFKTLDGYSAESLWLQVEAIKQTYITMNENDDPGAFRNMIPYVSGENSKAIEDIKSSVSFLESTMHGLIELYDIVSYPFNDVRESSTQNKVIECLQRGEHVGFEYNHIGTPNCFSKIKLATAYLQLSHMQTRLLLENWREELRLQVVAAREEYERAIIMLKYDD